MAARSFPPLAFVGAAALVALVGHTTLGDYDLRPSDDNPAPMIDALAVGDFGRAADVIPAMGLVSVVLRVPAAVIGGGNLDLVYGLGALLCLLPSLVLAWLVDRRLAVSGRPPLYRAVLGALLVAGPAVWFALDSGHPEEILGGTLCVAAVLAAQGGKHLMAAVLLGLAIGTKQWAIVAAFPVLLALDAPSPAPSGASLDSHTALAGPHAAPGRLFARERVRAALVGAVVSLACIGPVIAANPSRYETISRSLASAQRSYPQTLLWPAATASTQTIALGAGETQSLTTWKAPFGIGRGPALAITLLVALALVPWVRRAQGAPFARAADRDDRDGDDREPSQSRLAAGAGLADPLALLTVLLTVRCLLDPMNLDYYAAPALAALATWEATSGRRPSTRSGGSGMSRDLPFFSIAAAGAALVAWRVVGDAAPTIEWAVWIVATVPVLLVGSRWLSGGRASSAASAS